MGKARKLKRECAQRAEYEEAVGWGLASDVPRLREEKELWVDEARRCNRALVASRAEWADMVPSLELQVKSWVL